jgi:hypothetical protein
MLIKERTGEWGIAEGDGGGDCGEGIEEACVGKVHE